MTTPPAGRMTVVSNRLPLRVERAADGSWTVTPAAGGLVTALAPIMRSRGGNWVGWPGSSDGEDLGEAVARAGGSEGYRLTPVFLTDPELQGFYHGFSNEIVWPLFHDLQSLCNFDPHYWRSYVAVNEKYAGVVARSAAAVDFVWVHDYQLMLVGEALRRLDATIPSAFFLHIPFPAPDIFMKLPWRDALLRGLLAYDLVGFQTARDRRNFVDCVRDLLPEVQITGRGQAFVRLRHAGRELRAGRFPISIDHNDFLRRASAPAVVQESAKLRELLPDRQLILGIDRLDYTKGIPHRLRAFGDALQRYPELREKVTLIQVVVPSRADIPRYQQLKAQIDNLVGEINGRFTRPGGWVPIHYVYRNLSQEELLSYYRAAQIALITPLKDGMNLVAKEYCACSPDEDCVLILSEFAGAAAEMRNGALLVNPYDYEGVAAAIHAAFLMPPPERRARMRRLRRRIRRHDVYDWVEGFVHAVHRRGASAGVPAAVSTDADRTYQGIGSPR
jgi:trehalose 6-phosphate synthase